MFLFVLTKNLTEHSLAEMIVSSEANLKPVIRMILCYMCMTLVTSLITKA